MSTKIFQVRIIKFDDINLSFSEYNNRSHVEDLSKTYLDAVRTNKFPSSDQKRDPQRSQYQIDHHRFFTGVDLSIRGSFQMQRNIKPSRKHYEIPGLRILHMFCRN